MKPRFSKSGTRIVIFCVVCVVAALIYNFAVPTNQSKQPPAAMEDALPPPPTPAQATPPKPAAPNPKAAIESAKKFVPNFELLRERLGRDDPFAPLHPVVAQASELTDDMLQLPLLPPMTVENPPEHRLTAIAMRDGQGIAIVNGEIVREGDFVDRFVVDSISSKEVILLSGMGEKILLTIRQAAIPDFTTSGGVISNIPAEAEPLIREDGFIDVSPRAADSATSSAPIEPPGE